MKASSEEVSKRVQAAQKLWDELKARWTELKLPGSAYMPHDFTTLLMLADVEGDVEAVVERVRAAADRLAELKRDSRTSFVLLGSDAPAILALISADGIITSEPEPVVPPVVVQPPVPVEPPPPVTGCPNCGHGFDACAAGEYRLTPTPAAAPTKSDAFNPCVHVDAAGRCTECTKDETVECDDCGNAIVKSRGHACKNCDYIYCDDCKSDLSGYGYCPDCATLTCSGCDNDVDAGTEERCANEQCREDPAYCERCVDGLLNVKGLCMSCSGEEDVECDACGECFTESRVKFCAATGCDTCYCAAHTNNLDQKGLCANCA